MADTISVTIQLDRELKSNAESMLEDMGINLSVALNTLLRQAVRQGEIPFNKEADTGHVTDILKRLGPWEDTRDAETIIAEIRGSRVSKQDIVL
jgi:addiction module RelB/DinJ family antitoxin